MSRNILFCVFIFEDFLHISVHFKIPFILKLLIFIGIYYVLIVKHTIIFLMLILYGISLILFTVMNIIDISISGPNHTSSFSLTFIAADKTSLSVCPRS